MEFSYFNFYYILLGNLTPDDSPFSRVEINELDREEELGALMLRMKDILEKNGVDLSWDGKMRENKG